MKGLRGFEKLNFKGKCVRQMEEAVKSNPSLSELIDKANEMEYAISFTFIDDICYSVLDTKEHARKTRVSDV